MTVGNLVGPGSGPLARIVQLDPVRVVFSVTDRALVSLRQQEAAGQTITPQQFKLSLVLANGSTYPQRGTIQFIDNEVSTQTGTVAVRALFANPDQILVPGQVVAVQLLDEAIGELPVVPMASVMQDRQGKYVFVLGQDNRVSRRPIVTGARIGIDGPSQAASRKANRSSRKDCNALPISSWSHRAKPMITKGRNNDFRDLHPP